MYAVLILLFFVALMMVWFLRSATAFRNVWNVLIFFPKPQWLQGQMKCVSSRVEMFPLPGLCTFLVFPILHFQLWHPLEFQCHWSRHFFVLLLLCLVCCSRCVCLDLEIPQDLDFLIFWHLLYLMLPSVSGGWQVIFFAQWPVHQFCHSVMSNFVICLCNLWTFTDEVWHCFIFFLAESTFAVSRS